MSPGLFTLDVTPEQVPCRVESQIMADTWVPIMVRRSDGWIGSVLSRPGHYQGNTWGEVRLVPFVPTAAPRLRWWQRLMRSTRG